MIIQSNCLRIDQILKFNSFLIYGPNIGKVDDILRKIVGILKTDWNTEADIVYCANVTFPLEMMNNIAAMCRQLKSGARIVSLKKFECDYSEYMIEMA